MVQGMDPIEYTGRVTPVWPIVTGLCHACNRPTPGTRWCDDACMSYWHHQRKVALINTTPSKPWGEETGVVTEASRFRDTYWR